MRLKKTFAPGYRSLTANSQQRDCSHLLSRKFVAKSRHTVGQHNSVFRLCNNTPHDRKLDIFCAIETRTFRDCVQS